MLPGPPRRLGGRVAGQGRPFLLTHTIRCIPTQNSAIESLLSPSASASCQICRKCCQKMANGGEAKSQVMCLPVLPCQTLRAYKPMILASGVTRRRAITHSFLMLANARSLHTNNDSEPATTGKDTNVELSSYASRHGNCGALANKLGRGANVRGIRNLPRGEDGTWRRAPRPRRRSQTRLYPNRTSEISIHTSTSLDWTWRTGQQLD